jgi:putative transposase
MKTASYSHCHGESSFHIVFGPKYRHDVFGKDEIKTFCEKCFNEIAYKENFEIRALKVMEDHVHLFVSIPPKFSVSETVQYFKGYSSRKIFLEFPWLKQFEVGEKRFWGGNLWSRGYFFRSVGSTTGKAVEFYIKISQDKKQRDKYYSTGSNKNNRATTEDPFIEFLQNKLKQIEQKHEQRTLSTFFQ